ncbi:hypothetical protein B7P43_G17699 [Cryptotermes secundus]|uniref:BESS domain-containing protein n=1 Tax=Cryptotermes secundus TaxID=105785 RepID=A0A2J7PGK4_9NEOP|nr:hypothetical protein B7P43_G17699 [Cryptotermes secundus]
MRERRKLSTIPSGSATDSSKITLPFFTLLSILDVSLSHKKTTGNVPNIESRSMEGESQQNTEEINHEAGEEDSQNISKINDTENFASQNMKNTSSENRKWKKPGASGQDYIDKMYLNLLEKVTTRRKDDDPDYMFLKSLLPSIKKLGPLENIEFRGEVIQLLRHKLTSAFPVQFPSNPSSVQSRYQYSRPSSSPGAYSEFSIQTDQEVVKLFSIEGVGFPMHCDQY